MVFLPLIKASHTQIHLFWVNIFEIISAISFLFLFTTLYFASSSPPIPTFCWIHFLCSFFLLHVWQWHILFLSFGWIISFEGSSLLGVFCLVPFPAGWFCGCLSSSSLGYGIVDKVFTGATLSACLLHVGGGVLNFPPTQGTWPGLSFFLGLHLSFWSGINSVCPDTSLMWAVNPALRAGPDESSGLPGFTQEPCPVTVTRHCSCYSLHFSFCLSLWFPSPLFACEYLPFFILFNVVLYIPTK